MFQELRLFSLIVILNDSTLNHKDPEFLEIIKNEAEKAELF